MGKGRGYANQVYSPRIFGSMVGLLSGAGWNLLVWSGQETGTDVSLAKINNRRQRPDGIVFRESCSRRIRIYIRSIGSIISPSFFAFGWATVFAEEGRRMKELYEFAVNLAERAGEITLKYFRTDLKVESKSDQSPVTIADRQAEEFIRSEIEKRFPDDAILGEEFGEKPGRSGRRWILDPIDGTKTFIRGVAMYGTMIAVEDAGRAVVGVIRYPPNNETIGAYSGGGCFYNGARCRVSQTANLKEAAALTTAPDNFIKYIGQDALLRLFARTGLQRTWGDCYGYMLVATGRADIMIDPIVSIWDAAALIPIITEAGGRITDRAGREGLGISDVVATNGALHAATLELLAQE